MKAYTVYYLIEDSVDVEAEDKDAAEKSAMILIKRKHQDALCIEINSVEE